MKVVVDIGGTTTRVASSKDGKTILQKIRFKTPTSFEEGLEKIIDSIFRFTNKGKQCDVVLGIPGTIDHRLGKSIRVPNIPSWDNRDLAYIFQQKLGLSIQLANDAELGALGEASFGIGRAYKIVGYVTVSTGIGGALVVNKQLVARAFNSEPGHMVIDMGSRAKDGSGRTGTLEALASGSTFADRYGESPETCTDKKIWKQYTQVLGEGLCNIVLLWSPEILIIGGGFSQRKSLLFEPLVNFMQQHLMLYPSPPIVPSKLGDDAGLYGGILMSSKRS